MKNYYNQKLDRYISHDFPGVHGSSMHDFIMDEIELGARVAIMIQDPEQAWWEIVGNTLYEAEAHVVDDQDIGQTQVEA